MVMITHWQAEKVTKINAAERQIKEAIKLFFEQRDPISIHTLAGAAHQILYDISNESGMESMRNSLIIKDEYRKLWLDALNKAKNFLKHADRDPNVTLEFNPEMNVFLIADTLSIYIRLTHEVFPECVIFNTWFTLAYPELTKEGTLKNLVSEHLVAKGVSPYNYDAFRKILSDQGESGFTRIIRILFKRCETGKDQARLCPSLSCA